MKRKCLLTLSFLVLGGVSLFACRTANGAPASSAKISAGGCVNLNLELDRPVLPSDSAETVILKIGLDGVRQTGADRAPLNLALVIDQSGSMSGDKIRQARAAAHQALDHLGANDVVSLIAYNNHASVYWPAQRVGNGRGLRAAIDRIETGGGTNLFGGVELGATELRQRLRGDYVHRVILLSDGIANVGPSSPAALAGLGAGLRDEGIAVSTLGLGLDYNEDVMIALARRSDGNTYFVENSRDLPRVFEQEFGEAMNVVARELLVEVVFPEGVTPIRIVGRDGRVDRQRVELTMNQLYGGREQFALVEVRVAPGRHAESRSFAQVEVSFQQKPDMPRARIAGKVQVEFDADLSTVRERANHEVQADYALNRMVEVKEKVIELTDRGQDDEACRELESLAAAQLELSESYANAAVAKIAEDVSLQAERLRVHGMDNASRKSYRADNLQLSRQQTRP